MVRRALLATVLGACALLPATAHAGTYDVYSCKFGSNFYGNNAWVGRQQLRSAGDPTFTAPDTTCANAGDPLVALMRPGNAATPNVAYAPGSRPSLILTPPVDTRITDFNLSRAPLLQHVHEQQRHAYAEQHRLHARRRSVAYGVSLTGQWDADAAVRPASINADKHYYGAGGPASDTGVVTLSKARLAARHQARARPATMALYAGC